MGESSKRELLADSPLFVNLLPAELTMLAELCVEQTYESGETILREGDPGDAMFVIAEGAVEVRRKNARGEERAIARLEAPQFFGEMSLLDKQPRSATLIATQPSRLLRLSNDNLHVFAKHYRNGFTWVVVNIARTLSARLRETNQRLAERL